MLLHSCSTARAVANALVKKKSFPRRFVRMVAAVMLIASATRQFKCLTRGGVASPGGASLCR